MDYVFTRAMVVASGLGLAFVYSRLRSPPKFAEPPRNVSNDKLGEALRPNFAGFQWSSKEFQIDAKGQLWRINSDGSRHNVGMWRFNSDTGEFLRKGKSRNGITLVDLEGYKARAIKYVNADLGSQNIRVFIMLAISGGFAATVYYALFTAPEQMEAMGSPFWLIVGGFAGLGATICLHRIVLGFKKQAVLDLLVGPEPLQFGGVDHGPAVGEVDEMTPETEDWNPVA